MDLKQKTWSVLLPILTKITFNFVKNDFPDLVTHENNDAEDR